MRWVFRIVGLLILLMLLLVLLRPAAPVNDGSGPSRPQVSDPASTGREGLQRNASQVIYSKHARCRMGCRSISEQEVMDILRNGTINYQKSDLRGSPDPKYAVEGNTADGQRVRMVFAQSPRGVVVVTVIDLEKEWRCDCK